MVDYYNVTTNTGDAEIAAAIASNTKLAITHIAFGDGNGVVPTPLKTRTTLVREVHRQAVTKYERHSTNANWIVIETIIPSNIGGFWVREMGVIANGKMISHGSHAPFEKVADPTGVSEYRLKFTLNVKDGNVVNVTLDQSLIYASQAWTDENYVPRDEIIDNLTTDDADKVASAKQVKILQDNKLNKTDLKDASTEQKGVVQVNNTLTSTATNQALTAAQGKVLNDRFVNDFLSLKSENGYQKLPGGLIIQWGVINYANFPSEISVNVTFPIAFTSNCLNFGATRKMSAHGESGDGTVNLISTSKESALVSLQNITASTGSLRGFTWFSIGY